MRILAIDPGTSCGWALASCGQVYLSGVWDLSPRRHEGAGMRYLRLRKFLSEIHASETLGAVFYEEVHRHLGTDAAHCYGGLVAHIQAWCCENNVPYKGVPVATIKKAATGKGNANKEAMLDAAARAWPGIAMATDDEADARWCAVAAGEIV